MHQNPQRMNRYSKQNKHIRNSQKCNPGKLSKRQKKDVSEAKNRCSVDHPTIERLLSVDRASFVLIFNTRF